MQYVGALFIYLQMHRFYRTLHSFTYSYIMKLMDHDLVSIREAAEILGVSIDTLRRWDKSGKLKSIRTQGGHRKYRKSELDIFLNDLFGLAKEWVLRGSEIPSIFHCSISSIFQARLSS